jgi:hypothetical protein
MILVRIVVATERLDQPRDLSFARPKFACMANAGSFEAIGGEMHLCLAHDRTPHAGDLRTIRALDTSCRTRDLRIATPRIAGTSAGIRNDAVAGAGDARG